MPNLHKHIRISHQEFLHYVFFSNVIQIANSLIQVPNPARRPSFQHTWVIITYQSLKPRFVIHNLFHDVWRRFKSHHTTNSPMFIKLTAGKLRKIKWLNREKASYIENIEKTTREGGRGWFSYQRRRKQSAFKGTPRLSGFYEFSLRSWIIITTLASPFQNTSACRMTVCWFMLWIQENNPLHNIINIDIKMILKVFL